MNKKLLSIYLSFVCVFCGITPVSAKQINPSDDDLDNITTETEEIDLNSSEVIVYDENGEVVVNTLSAESRDISGVSRVIASGHKENSFIGWHPAFSAGYYDGYYLSSTQSTTYTTSVEFLVNQYFSVTFSIQASGGSGGTFYKADSSIITKLAMYSTYDYVVYRTDMYDNYTGNYVGSKDWTKITKTGVDRYVAEYYKNH